jgi:hypothetical protein
MLHVINRLATEHTRLLAPTTLQSDQFFYVKRNIQV